MSEINESPNTTGCVDRKGEFFQGKAVEDAVSLTPRKITDVNEVAKLWSHVRISNETVGGCTATRAEVSGGWGSDISEITFIKTSELKRALYALANPEFSKIIKVDAMAFPALYCKDKVKKEEKWYEEVLFKDGERMELIPLIDKRVGRDDPWKDERFDLLDANCPGNHKARVDDETCIWVECKDCHGQGGYNGKVFAGIGDQGQKKCPHCGGTGKIGARLCPECKGYGHYYSYSQVEKFKPGWVSCKTCGGKGKLRSALKLHHKLATDDEKIARFFTIPEETIPSALPAEDEIELSGFVDYRELCKSSAVDDLDIPKCGIDGEVIKAKIAELHNLLLPTRAHCLDESVSVGICTRYVRFHLTFLVGAVDFDTDGNASKIEENALKGILPKDYFTRMPHMQYECDMILWMDMLDGRVYGKFPPRKDCYSYVAPKDIFVGILMKMGMSIPGKEAKGKRSANREQRKDETRPVNKTRSKCVASGDKKRWKFIVLGILFGWIGAHYIYAKRWGLFLLHVTAFIGLLIAPPLGLLWLATWFGGAFFVKKDGSKNRLA